MGAHWEPIGEAKWCNEPPNLEKGASLVPEGVPRAPQSPPGPPKALPEVDLGVILERFGRYLGLIWEAFSLNFSMLAQPGRFFVHQEMATLLQQSRTMVPWPQA